MSKRILIPALVGALLLIAIASLSAGAVAVDGTWHQILHPFSGNSTAHQIIWDLRAPRILAAILVGSILGVAGVIAQASTQNPLADPSIIGTSAGASLGVLIAVLFNVVSIGSIGAIVAAAIGALLATLVTLTLSRNSLQLIIVGIGISSTLTAIVGLTVSMITRPDARSVSFWAMGSFALVTKQSALILFVVLLLVLAATYLLSSNLDLLALGDTTVRHFGVDPQRIRFKALLILALAVAATVSTVGTISFLALAAPHIARFIVGPKNRTLLFSSALIGSLILLISDTASRSVAPPHELPIGLITSLIGAPILILALKRSREVWK